MLLTNRLKILMLLVVFCYSSSVIANADYEFAESAKCSKYFSYFEKKYRLPLETLHSIGLQESGKKHSKYNIRIVWPWTVNVSGSGYYFNTKAEAIRFVKKQIMAGKSSIDVGCMQINLNYHIEAFYSLDNAFDPKHNIRYAAEFVRSKYDQYHDWHKAIAHYHSATHDIGFKYKEDIMVIAKKMNDYKYNLNELVRPSIKRNRQHQLSDTDSAYSKVANKVPINRDEKFLNKINRPIHSQKGNTTDFNLSPYIHIESNNTKPTLNLK